MFCACFRRHHSCRASASFSALVWFLCSCLVFGSRFSSLLLFERSFFQTMARFLFVFVFICLLGLSLADKESIPLPYDFTSSENDVVTNSAVIPFDNTGTQQVSVSSENEVYLCINFLVPAEVPAVDLDELKDIWSQNCGEFAVIPAGMTAPTDYNLRSGANYFSLAAVQDDAESLGFPFDATLTLTYDTCPAGSFGTNCDAYAPMSYGDNTKISIVSGSSDDDSFFTLPTRNPDNTNRFVKQLQFQFNFEDAGDPTTVTLAARMNAPLNTQDQADFTCEGKKNGDKCQLPSPPFVFAQDFFWTLSLFASAAIPSANVTITQNTCGNNKIGDDCTKYETLDTDLGAVSKYSGNEFFVFNISDLSGPLQVAVGGLDGYKQTDLAPPLYVQLDAAPTEDSFFLLSNGSMTNVVQIDFSSDGNLNSSSLVVLVDASSVSKKSYGIWLFDGDSDVFCANPCDKHGTCDNSTFVCDCEKDYEDLGCNHKKDDFTIEYIILIAVGGLLILAIVIGVPLYCYLNRQQAAYESVA